MKNISPEHIEKFFRRLAAGFTKRPNDIGVDLEYVDGDVSMTLRPSGADVGALIGSSGIMHLSLRCILTAYAARGELGFHLSPIIEPKDRTPLPDNGTMQMSIEQIGELFTETCAGLFGKVHAWSWEHDDRRSNICLIISKNEARKVSDAQLGESLSRIFNAIGHCNCRKIYVLLERAKS